MFTVNPKAANPADLHPPVPGEEAPRRERHLAIAQEVIDLSVEATRYAAQRVRAAHEDSLATPATAPRPGPGPHLPAPRRLHPPLRSPRGQIASNAFAQSASPKLSRTPELDVHDLMEAVNRDTIVTALTHLTEHREDRPELRQSFDDIVKDSFSAFPDNPLSAHLDHACQALGIRPNLTALPARLAAEIAGRPLEEPAPTPPERWPRVKAA